MTYAPNILTVLGYNTHLFVDTIVAADPKQTYHDQERIDAIIAKIREIEPDIVGLSEVWANKSKWKFTNGLKDILPYFCYDENNRQTEMGSGLLLLSRHPISWHEFQEYYNLTSWDADSQKGFLKAVVDIDSDKNKPLLVVLTHTNSGDFRDQFSKPAEARHLNLIQIRDWIVAVQWYTQYTSMIILGDLNVDASQPEYKDNLLSTFEIAPFNIVDSDSGDPEGYTVDEINNKLNQRFSPSSDPCKMRVDYMFISTDERCPVRRVSPHSVIVPNYFKFTSPDGVMDLSDHYPLYGAFDVRYGGVYSVEADWRYCIKCQGLFYGPNIDKSHCPANDNGRGPHTYIKGDISCNGSSFNYALVHNMDPQGNLQGNYQREWRICDNCQGLFYGPYMGNSICPATNGNHHFPRDSPNYFLLHDLSSSRYFQSDWRYCDRCKGLYYGPYLEKSHCPANDNGRGPHTYIEGGSFNYLLPIVTWNLRF
jgi:endonuclease/exonuclease/phosphatase family metal-dependent hydrolase